MIEKVCRDCGTVAEPVTITKGSLGTEILLWLCLLLPGMFYTAWRHGSRYDGCPKCSSANLVPLDSPIGRELSKNHLPASVQTARAPRAGAVAFGRSLGRLFAKK
ncbi:MAG: hypothetical protein Q8N13_14415 [Acidovorax sp.]|nr:hypothetical protein [Acidovorax sp.]